MHPTLFDISTPWFTIPVRSYGVMLMIGFLIGVWWTCKRAARVKANPDIIINIAMIGLVAGIVGGRLFFVIHYYDQFAGQGWGQVINITRGGMEFYGSFIGCFVGAAGYLLIKRASFRLYMDILAPAFMLGIAFGRIGCFLNGCCWGAVCTNLPWAVEFPHDTRIYVQQWEDRLITVPAELIYINRSTLDADVLMFEGLNTADAEYEQGAKALAQARKALSDAKNNDADTAAIKRLEKQLNRAQERYGTTVALVSRARRQAARFGMTRDQLRALAMSANYEYTHPVHPVQLYAAINALVGAFLLNAIFYRRKRHGVVAGLFFFIYPVFRIIEEIIRADNPHDTLGLTISTFTSLVLLGIGVVWMIVVYKLPLRAPAAYNHIPDYLKREPTTDASTA